MIGAGRLDDRIAPGGFRLTERSSFDPLRDPLNKKTINRHLRGQISVDLHRPVDRLASNFRAEDRLTMHHKDPNPMIEPRLTIADSERINYADAIKDMGSRENYLKARAVVRGRKLRTIDNSFQIETDQCSHVDTLLPGLKSGQPGTVGTLAKYMQLPEMLGALASNDAALPGLFDLPAQNGFVNAALETMSTDGARPFITKSAMQSAIAEMRVQKLLEGNDLDGAELFNPQMAARAGQRRQKERDDEIGRMSNRLTPPTRPHSLPKTQPRGTVRPREHGDDQWLKKLTELRAVKSRPPDVKTHTVQTMTEEVENRLNAPQKATTAAAVHGRSALRSRTSDNLHNNRAESANLQNPAPAPLPPAILKLESLLPSARSFKERQLAGAQSAPKLMNEAPSTLRRNVQHPVQHTSRTLTSLDHTPVIKSTGPHRKSMRFAGDLSATDRLQRTATPTRGHVPPHRPRGSMPLL